MTLGWRVHRLVAVVAGLVTLHAGAAHARMGTAPPLGVMVRNAARIFRGHCTAARVESVDVAGARIPVTVYTFHVGEHLKGGAAAEITFRQVGVPDGGARDLGRLVGLPAYAPGTEYVLFLLPAGREGMTSPAGAGDGAFEVRGGRLRAAHGDHGPSPAPVAARATAKAPAARGAGMSYEELRDAVREEMRR